MRNQAADQALDEARGKGFGGAAAVTLAGVPVLAEATGAADDRTGAPCVVESCLRACSVGKQFVAVCALLLAEDGLLDLHAPIGRYLPESSDHPADWRALTTHHLLTHTAGFGHWREVAGFDPENPYTPDEIIARRARRPLLSKPGAEYAYSGVGYLLAARVVEHVSGQGYQAFTTERIFAPLGMHGSRSGAAAPGPAAVGHVAGRPVDSDALAEIPGTGDLWTTVGDLGRFARAFARDELLGAASRGLMCTAHIPLPAGESSFGEVAGYGYGYAVGTVDGRRMHCHTGDIPGYRSMYVSIPSLDASIVVLSNREEADAAGLANRLYETVLAPAAADAPPPERWELWREDDNGNRYLVSAHEDEPAAHARLAAFETGVVHKQRYWVKSHRVA
ncbi:MAG TPA: serine hydrolase domain-containing protein [Actinospica sp.]|jgi:CubicO group peptidase (beta-lactamase class C family)|nr:serine hydrolase domain-containing protein [Actinospica sp.]